MCVRVREKNSLNFYNCLEIIHYWLC